MVGLLWRSWNLFEKTITRFWNAQRWQFVGRLNGLLRRLLVLSAAVGVVSCSDSRYGFLLPARRRLNKSC